MSDFAIAGGKVATIVADWVVCKASIGIGALARLLTNNTANKVTTKTTWNNHDLFFTVPFLIRNWHMPRYDELLTTILGCRRTG